MKKGEHPLLQSRAHVDQYIAATNEIELGERRIFAQVMARKHAPVTDLHADLVAVSHFHKKTLQTFRGEIGHRSFRVCSRPRTVNGRRADIRAENLDRGRRGASFQEFQQRDGDREHAVAERLEPVRRQASAARAPGHVGHGVLLA